MRRYCFPFYTFKLLHYSPNLTMQHGYVHKMWLIQHSFYFSITRKRTKNKTHGLLLSKVRIVPLSTTGFTTNENCTNKVWLTH